MSLCSFGKLVDSVHGRARHHGGLEQAHVEG
jgi:hypothetical protein